MTLYIVFFRKCTSPLPFMPYIQVNTFFHQFLLNQEKVLCVHQAPFHFLPRNIASFISQSFLWLHYLLWDFWHVCNFQAWPIRTFAHLTTLSSPHLLTGYEHSAEDSKTPRNGRVANCKDSGLLNHFWNTQENSVTRDTCNGPLYKTEI